MKTPERVSFLAAVVLHVLSVSVDKCTFDLKLTTTQRVLK